MKTQYTALKIDGAWAIYKSGQDIVPYWVMTGLSKRSAKRYMRVIYREAEQAGEKPHWT